ncbi:hypothetical protein CDT92_21710, partial [Cronobacter sakazakii]
YSACLKLREAAANKLGCDPNRAEFFDGNVQSDGRIAALADAAADGTLTVEDTMEYGDLDKQFQKSTFAGHLGEGAVEANTGVL